MKHFKNKTHNFVEEEEDIYLRPVAALACVAENEINWTSLDVCVSVDTLIKGVVILVICIEAVNLPSTERTSRNTSCGGSFGGGSFGSGSSSNSSRGVGLAGTVGSHHWWMCGYRRGRQKI